MYDHIRQIIETRIFRDGNAVRELSFPMFMEGRQVNTPNGSNWGMLFVADSINIRTEFGGSFDTGNRESGSIRIKLFAPHGDGTRLIREMATELSSFLNYSTGSEGISGIEGNLFLKNGKLTMVSEDDDGYLHFNLDYIYDYYN
jgi:hypothetical protein